MSWVCLPPPLEVGSGWISLETTYITCLHTSGSQVSGLLLASVSQSHRDRHETQHFHHHMSPIISINCWRGVTHTRARVIGYKSRICCFGNRWSCVLFWFSSFATRAHFLYFLSLFVFFYLFLVNGKNAATPAAPTAESWVSKHSCNVKSDKHVRTDGGPRPPPPPLSPGLVPPPAVTHLTTRWTHTHPPRTDPCLPALTPTKSKHSRVTALQPDHRPRLSELKARGWICAASGCGEHAARAQPDGLPGVGEWVQKNGSGFKCEVLTRDSPGKACAV